MATKKLAKIGPCVSIFGSVKVKTRRPLLSNGSRYCQKITEIGFGVITGGGPGIMEAGNKGAREGNGKSID